MNCALPHTHTNDNATLCSISFFFCIKNLSQVFSNLRFRQRAAGEQIGLYIISRSFLDFAVYTIAVRDVQLEKCPRLTVAVCAANVRHLGWSI